MQLTCGPTAVIAFHARSSGALSPAAFPVRVVIASPASPRYAPVTFEKARIESRGEMPRLTKRGYAQDPRPYEAAHGGVNPYPALMDPDNLLPDGEWQYVLTQIPVTELQALPMNYGEPNESS